jgi:hypothetical protein
MTMLDSDGPDYNPDAFLEAADQQRKAERESRTFSPAEVKTIEAKAQRLFFVTIKRVHSAASKAKWPASGADHESTFPDWGESAETVRARREANLVSKSPYWAEKFTDTVEAVVEGDVVAERARCVEMWERMRRVFRDRYAPCCDLAVLRPCVCSISYSCPEHGNTCHGTHD